MIEPKRDGKEVKAKSAEKTAAAPDLLAALTASLDQARDAREARTEAGQGSAQAG